MEFILDIKRLWKIVFERFLLMYNLFSFFETQVNINIRKLALFKVVSKSLNMLVMFLPIKLLFLLSGIKNIPFLSSIEIFLGKEIYVTLMLILTAFLYLLNAILKIRLNREIKLQINQVENECYIFLDKEVDKGLVESTYNAYSQLVSDITLIILVFILATLFSPLLAIYFSLIVFAYTFLVEFFVFIPNKFNLLERLNLSQTHFLNIVNSLLYFILFIGVVVALLVSSMHIFVAIILMLLMRLVTTSLKTVFTSQIVLRKSYLN